MKNTYSYLIGLLDHVDAPWTENLRQILISAAATGNSVNLQHCTVEFAFSQALRRLKTTRVKEKRTFGIESLIEELRHLNENMVLDYYIISTENYLGTCFVLEDRLIGCEFVIKSGTKSMPGLWID